MAADKSMNSIMGPAIPVVEGPYSYANITTAVNTQVKTGAGVLYAISFNKPVATGVIQISDAASKTTPTIGTITVPASPQPVTLFYNTVFSTGLNIDVATAAQDITVLYK